MNNGTLFISCVSTCLCIYRSLLSVLQKVQIVVIMLKLKETGLNWFPSETVKNKGF